MLQIVESGQVVELQRQLERQTQETENAVEVSTKDRKLLKEVTKQYLAHTVSTNINQSQAEQVPQNGMTVCHALDNNPA